MTGVVDRPAFRRMQKFVETFVRAGKIARMFGADQVDALHPGNDVVVISAVAAEAHKIFGELQARGKRFVVRRAADRARSIVQFFEGDLARWELVQDHLYALRFIATHQRLLQLLKVDWRTVFGVDSAQLIPGQNVNEKFVLFEALDPFFEHSRAHFGRLLAFAHRRVAVE